MANKLALWDPFKELEKLEESFFAPLGTQATLFAPATDVYVEDDKQLVVEAHLPGLSEKDVEVSVHEGVLEIRAESANTLGAKALPVTSGVSPCQTTLTRAKLAPTLRTACLR